MQKVYLKPNTKKIEVINSYPEPKKLKELRSFLGMITEDL